MEHQGVEDAERTEDDMHVGQRLLIEGTIDGSIESSRRPIGSRAIAVAAALVALFLLYALVVFLLSILITVLVVLAVAIGISMLWGGTSTLSPATLAAKASQAGSRLFGDVSTSVETLERSASDIQVTAFRIGEPSTGRFYQCIAQGELADGVLEQEDDLGLSGIVGLDNTVHVTKVHNRTTDIASRPQRPARWWISWAAKAFLVLMGLYIAFQLLQRAVF